MGYKLIDSLEGMRYEEGDKVVVFCGKTCNGFNLKNKVVEIVGIREWHSNTPDYMINIDPNYCLEDKNINHEATERLKEDGFALVDSHEKMRYKKGDRIVIESDALCHDLNLKGAIAEVVGIRIWDIGSPDYKINIAPASWFYDGDINHEATERLNTQIKEDVKPIDLLENGCVVEFRNGERALVLKGGELYTQFYGNQDFCFVFRDGFEVGSNYNESLERIDRIMDNDGFRIDKIYKRDICGIWFMFEEEGGMELIWERPAKKEPKPYKITASEILRLLNLKEGTKIEIDLER